MRFSAYLYVMPFMFVYTPVLMPDGFNMDVLQTWIGLSLAVVPFAASVTGYLFGRVSLAERGLMFLSSVLMALPDWRLSVLGLAIFGGLAVLGYNRRKALSAQIGGGLA